MAVSKKIIINGKSYDRDKLPPEIAKRQRKRLGDMLAHQQAPGLKSCTSGFKGVGMLRDQFRTQREFEFYVRKAREKGGNPQPNDVYMPQLASETADPKAFVAREDVESRTRAVCEERGWACDGDIKVKARSAEELADKKSRESKS